MTPEEREIYQEQHRRIVCAANRLKSGLVVCGARHHDSIMNAQIKASGQNHFYSEQGFIDQYGNFWNREEAWIIARRQNQITKLVGNQNSLDEDNELFSENLY